MKTEQKRERERDDKNARKENYREEEMRTTKIRVFNSPADSPYVSDKFSRYCHCCQAFEL